MLSVVPLLKPTKEHVLISCVNTHSSVFIISWVPSCTNVTNYIRRATCINTELSQNNSQGHYGTLYHCGSSNSLIPYFFFGKVSIISQKRKRAISTVKVMVVLEAQDIFYPKCSRLIRFHTSSFQLHAIKFTMLKRTFV